MDCVIIHYSEIGTKSGNRPFFERALAHSIVKALGGRALDVHRIWGRLKLDPAEGADLHEICRDLAYIPGIAFATPARQVGFDLKEITEAALAMSDEFVEGSFAIRPIRSWKVFPQNSVEIGQVVGAAVQARKDRPVDLSKPDNSLFVEITEKGVFLYREKYPGLGGLPIGVSGKLVALISGGIDSPVAAFKMIRRGCTVIFVHFRNRVPDSSGVKDKIQELVQILTRHQIQSRLYVVPFEQLQRRIIAVVPARYRMIAYRRMMFRIGERIVSRENAKGFVTGDSVGQVASQTLDNILTIYRSSSFPIHAPLIGEDKQEIIRLAKKIGTYETSILPYSDCCTFMVAKHPETRMNSSDMDDLEEGLRSESVQAEVDAAFEKVEIHDIEIPRGEA